MIGDLLRIYGIQAKKQLSQNFILNDQVLRKVAGYVLKSPSAKKESKETKSLVFVEVGPGPGSITRALLNVAPEHGIRLNKFAVVEKDERFMNLLGRMSSASKVPFKVIKADILKLSHADIRDALALLPGTEASSVTLFGNLPFNISTALLVQWMHMIHLKHGLFEQPHRTRMVLTFQKEVADRLLATPKTKTWSRLSALVQSMCQVRPLYGLPSSVFTPKPKVDSTLLEITPLVKPVLENGTSSFCLENLLALAFSQRRKMLRNSFIKPFVSKLTLDSGKEDIEMIRTAEKVLEQVGATAEMRPEQLNPKQWVKLAQLCVQHNFIDQATVDAAGKRRWIPQRSRCLE